MYAGTCDPAEPNSDEALEGIWYMLLELPLPLGLLLLLLLLV